MIKVKLYNEKYSYLILESIKEVVIAVLMDHGYLDGNISIICVDDDELKEMKKEYFGEDLYTDVISFNLEDDPLDGELYISCDRIKSNAIEFIQSYDEELKRVIIHGLLHICGHKDYSKKEKEKMTNLENRFLEKIRNLKLIY